MPSGFSLGSFTPLANEPPAANNATLDVRNSHVLLDFDPDTAEAGVFSDVLPRHYSGQGITVTVIWLAETATTGNVVWQAAFERAQDEVTDLDTDSFAAFQSATGAAPALNGSPQYTEIALTDGAQIDNLAAGERYRLKIQRDATNVGDTMADDAEIIAVELRET